ncbi:hypothetical protein [Streptomyces cyaneus]|uniref:hypothetical protein n=1 Tax=Streptomyces cyaneus TaxID=1904 RepID=UPI000FF87769
MDAEPLRDPASYGRTVEHPLFTPILGDEDNAADPRFAQERESLLARLRPAAPAERLSSP